MPIMKVPGMPDDKATLEELTDHVAMLQKAVEWLMNGNLDSANAFEFGGWRIENNRLYSKKGNGIIQVYDTDEFLRLEAGAYDLEKQRYGIRISSPKSQQFVLNEHGFNPAFIKYYKNLVFNSSFERFTSSGLPLYWIGTEGVISTPTSFFGDRSLKIPVGGIAEQQYQTTIKGSPLTIPPSPDFWGRTTGRIAFMKKFGAVAVQVMGDGEPLTLTLPDGSTSQVWELPYNEDWTNGRFTCAFDPAAAERVWLRFTNTDATEDTYIDAVQMEPDFTGEWASFYTDGPYSLGAPDGYVDDSVRFFAINPSQVVFTSAFQDVLIQKMEVENKKHVHFHFTVVGEASAASLLTVTFYLGIVQQWPIVKQQLTAGFNTVSASFLVLDVNAASYSFKARITVSTGTFTVEPLHLRVFANAEIWEAPAAPPVPIGPPLFTAQAFGRNNQGQLGVGFKTTTSPQVVASPTNSLTALTGGIKDVSLGFGNMVAVDDQGNLWSCGSSPIGLSVSQATPTISSFTGIKKVANDVQGSGNLFLKTDGTVWYVGFGSDGERAGVTAGFDVATQIPGLTDVVEIYMGSFNCFALKSNGDLYAWGENSFGAIGGSAGSHPNVTVPTLRLSGVKEVATGNDHIFALKTNGELYAWGLNRYGACGLPYNSADYNIYTPTLTATNVKQIACGAWNSLYMATDGKVYATGNPVNGATATGVTTIPIDQRDDPTQDRYYHWVLTQFPTDLDGISCGDLYSFGWRGNTIYACGQYGSSNCLGDGRSFDTSTVQVNIISYTVAQTVDKIVGTGGSGPVIILYKK